VKSWNSEALFLITNKEYFLIQIFTVSAIKSEHKISCSSRLDRRQPFRMTSLEASYEIRPNGSHHGRISRSPEAVFGME
jgi:hypothetical protein